MSRMAIDRGGPILHSIIVKGGRPHCRGRILRISRTEVRQSEKPHQDKKENACMPARFLVAAIQERGKNHAAFFMNFMVMCGRRREAIHFCLFSLVVAGGMKSLQKRSILSTQMKRLSPRDATQIESRHAIAIARWVLDLPHTANRIIRRVVTMLPICAALLVTGLTASAQQTPMSTGDRNNRPLALEDATSPQPAESETQLRAALKQYPQSPDLLYKLALVLRLEGKTQESLQTYTQAAALRQPTAVELRSVALDYVHLNDYDDAIRWLRVALTLAPRDVDVLYSLGRCLYTQNQFHQAEIAFTKALEADPHHLKSEENLGLTLSAENQPAPAEAALRTAAQWAEQRKLPDPWPYTDLGSFLLEQQQPANALPYLRKALEFDAASAMNHQNLGRAFLALGKSAEGIAELQAAAKIEPNNPKIHFQLGHAYRDAGQAEKARAEFELSKQLYGQHSQN